MSTRQDDSPERERLLMNALRENVAILRELAMRYEVSTYRGRPVARGEQVTIPDDIARILAPEMEPLMQEQFRVVLLDNKNRVMGQHLVYQGNVGSIQIRTAEVFREAVVDGVPHIVVAHNHPSGDPEPSPEDVLLTGFLLEAGRILDIAMLDHIIIGQGSFVSLRTRALPRSSQWPSL